MTKRDSTTVHILVVTYLILMIMPCHAVTFSLEIMDKSSGKTVPARVLIRAADGHCYFPEGAVTLEIGPDIWFMSSGRSSIEVPAGNALIRIERGKEYFRVKESIDVDSTGQSFHKTVVMERWINLKKRGYLSGENHLHRPVGDIAALCAAEDLNFGSVLQWWKGPALEVDTGGGNVRDLVFSNFIIPTSVYDVEIENEWGAFYMIGNPVPYPYPDRPGMPILVTAEYGRQFGTLNCYQSGWSREVLVDALSCLVDVVNVCNNNFHMHRYQPRSFYSNLLNVDGLPVYPDTPEGMMQMNFETYYRLLNCGLHLSAGAGSATGVKQVPVGYNRAYVRCSLDGDLSEYIEGLRKGRNFVTNGPMVFFKSANGLKPGDSFTLPDTGGTVGFEIEVISDSPLKSIEIVVNGEVKKRFMPTTGQTIFATFVTIEIDRSSWVCARCVDVDMLLTDTELAAYEGPPVRLNQKPNRLRFAHTSPIYMYCGKSDIAVKKSIEEGLRIIKAFRSFACANSDPEYRDKMKHAEIRAGEVLHQKLAQAN